MTLRTRLTLAFVYILATIIVALTIPLAINLSRRATAEFERDTLIVAQTLAAVLNAEDLASRREVRRVVRSSIAGELTDSIERIVIVDAGGGVLWDSDGEEPIGSDFATAARPEVRSALLDGLPTATVRFSEEEGRDIMVAAAPIIDQTIVGAVRLTRRIDDVGDAIRRTTLGLIVIGGAGLLAGVVIAFALAGSLARPIQQLAGAARRLGAGDLRARAGEVPGTSEITALARSFDEMADRVERTVRAQREFVANASHQLRTPLTGLKLQLESAIADSADPAVRERLQAADREVDRLAQIVERLLAAAREVEEGVATHADLGRTAREAADRWAERAGRVNAVITVAGLPGDGPHAIANPADLDQILDNLIDNAIAHGASPVELSAGVDDRRVAWVSVRDHGPGIPEDDRERVTERFYRGRGAGPGGSGLGLAIARELTEKWGGSLAIEQPDGGGTRIVVRLRPAPASPAS
ncbi:MAG: two-component sensor histidine kinase [Actinomycetota bacterium]|jgi:signal transduction histidine kinase|nr:MAG: two-component sensor histidine kinase [Actinomycetota bacterium]